MDQILNDIKLGWTAPLLLVVICTLMALPVTAVVIMICAAITGGDAGIATALGAVAQILVTFWIAGYRLRRRQSQD